MKKLMLAGAAALALSGCGGGSGGSSGGGGTPPTGGGGGAPTITTNGNISVAEDNIGPVELSASVAGASFSLSGGADQALFRQSGNRFEFRAPVSFETPRDANGDNVYEVELTVTANGQSDSKLFKISVTDAKEGIDAVRVASGLGQLGVATRKGFNQVVAVRSDMSLVQYDVTTKAVTELGTPKGLGTGHDAILALGHMDSGDGDEWLIAADRMAGEVVILYYANGLDQDPFEVENVPFTDPGEIWVSIFGRDVALGDNGSKAAAYSASDPFGNVRYFTPNGSGGGSLSFYANGFHKPVLTGDFWVDLNDNVNEYNSPGSNHFGWGQFEGEMATGWTPDSPQGVTFPMFKQGSGSGALESFLITGAASVSYVTSDLSDYFVTTRDGKIFTYSTIYAQEWGLPGWERRDADFAPDAGSLDAVVASFLVDDQPVGGSMRFPLIVDADGEIFLVR
ncbi:hypothetical protein [Sphingomicrobium arenosum]|uniref:hypothetical protein n=1 Tax=Sphingomicrobium arenosum TaxID=2233861 RepID=UPI002240F21F|nr:hypothetical protein [Sphingomicrobium arenosum]